MIKGSLSKKVLIFLIIAGAFAIGLAWRTRPSKNSGEGIVTFSEAPTSRRYPGVRHVTATNHTAVLVNLRLSDIEIHTTNGCLKREREPITLAMPAHGVATVSLTESDDLEGPWHFKVSASTHAEGIRKYVVYVKFLYLKCKTRSAALSGPLPFPKAIHPYGEILGNWTIQEFGKP